SKVFLVFHGMGRCPRPCQRAFRSPFGNLKILTFLRISVFIPTALFAFLEIAENSVLQASEKIIYKAVRKRERPVLLICICANL
ncbi:MAG: hypothetical protein IJE71_03000, partial [Clostridia bacterium]|nr:hypothetical protein [Clostridia bacterium]